MSERKVLSKYIPPDFDPSAIERVRGPKRAGPKVQPVRLMAPYSMKCIACGEYIYKGRKFNARKETTDEKYLNITIYRFYIRCTRCSAEITFKTDPRNMDYESERGAKRNFEMWRNADAKAETDEERLDRLEAEEANKDAMDELETKMVDAQRDMKIADALDAIRTNNARVERAAHDGDVGLALPQDKHDEERERQEKEDEEQAKAAFSGAGGVKVRRLVEDEDGEPDTAAPALTADESKDRSNMPPPPTFKKGVKRKKDFSAALGIKKKPSLV